MTWISFIAYGDISFLPRTILGQYFIGCLGDILFISLLPGTIFHWMPGRYFIYFIAAWDNISLVAWAIFYLFHCCLGQYFIGCLGRYFIYFIAAWDDISLVAWAIFYLFHCCLGRYFIGCLSDNFFISLLPRTIFHRLQYFLVAVYIM